MKDCSYLSNNVLTRRKLIFIAALAAALPFSFLSAQACPVTGLRAEYRQGQVFLTWQEPPGEHRGTFNIYLSGCPINGLNLGQTTLLARRIEAHAARDWWKDPLTYFRKDPAGVKPEGFVIAEGGEPLDPSGGLFVHTVADGEPQKAFYAVTMTTGGEEDRTVLAGANSLEQPVIQGPAPIRPIWLGSGDEKPARASASGLPTIFNLHGRTGSEPVTWLAFGTREMGWREGLPFKFHAVVEKGRLLISPTDRTWLGRTLNESWDQRDHLSPANDTFWYGYNNRVYDRELMPFGTPVNFTERRNLWILSWARDYFRPDRDRTVLEGGSMGGCGGLSWGLRHPEIFSAIVSRVPLAGYFRQEWGGSEKRLSTFCGPLDRKDNEGAVLRTRMDARTVLNQAEAKGIDLPLLVISNARNDASIPWRPNPRYYRALNASRQGFFAGWDNGVHSNCMKNCDPWFKKLQDPAYLCRFSLKESFPAFSNFSLNDDPGTGDKENGDITGYMNFGLEWKDILDEPDRYAVTLHPAAATAGLPATVDVTLRRVQRFILDPGEEVILIEETLGGREIIRTSARANRTGHITFRKFNLISAEGERLIILRANQP
ncbi:MAG: hypothetical protein U9P14_05790 [Gemmatimonadota bacterium]|nr:hypothetical protein [Gemmatimonadota bacterium]